MASLINQSRTCGQEAESRANNAKNSWTEEAYETEKTGIIGKSREAVTAHANRKIYRPLWGRGLE